MASEFTDSNCFVIRRPRAGAAQVPGKAVKAVTNNVHVRVRKGMRLIFYTVTFEPELGLESDPKQANAQKSSFLNKNKDAISAALKAKRVLPQGSTLYALASSEPQAIVSIDLDHPSGQVIRTTFKQKKNLTSETGEAGLFSAELLLYYNIAVRETARATNLSLLGKYAYDPNKAMKIQGPNNISVFTGYYVSLNQYEIGMALQVDVRHKILQNMFASDVLKGLGSPDNALFRAEAERSLVGRTVMTSLGGDKKILYKIERIDWGSTIMTTFERKGEEISVKDYYKTHHNIQLREATMPLLVSYLGKRIQQRECKLPVEICQITGLDDKLRGNNSLMMEVAKITRLKPQPKFEKGRALNERLMASGLDKWGVELGDTVEVMGREIPENQLEVINNWVEAEKLTRNEKPRGNAINRARINFPHFLQKGVMGYKEQGQQFRHWVILHTSRDGQMAEGLAMEIKRCLEQYRIKVGAPTPISVNAPSGDAFVSALKGYLTPQVMANAKPSMVVALLPGDGQAYGALKKFLVGQAGIVSQCIRVKTFGEKGQQALPKLVHQMIVKTGGSLWGLPTPPKGVRTVAMGVDVLRSGGKIYAALTASTNYLFTEYYNTVTVVQDMSQVSTWLCKAVVDATKAFHARTNKAPDRIIVYRDGVGESQKAGLRGEIEGCLEGLATIDKIWADKLEFGFIVVNKKVNQRFAVPMDRQQAAEAAQKASRGGRGGGSAPPPKEGDLTNPMPLTVFDKGIVDPTKFDFFGVHQEVTAGTVTPTHYDVLFWRVPRMTPAELQDFTGQLSMLYQNWPGPIRVPAPVMYATKMCTMMSQYVQMNRHVALANTHFYL